MAPQSTFGPVSDSFTPLAAEHRPRGRGRSNFAAAPTLEIIDSGLAAARRPPGMAEDLSYAALAEGLAAAFAAFSRASLARICDSVSCTLLSNTYCAGRWFDMSISGAIGPSVRRPFQAIIAACSGCCIIASA